MTEPRRESLDPKQIFERAGLKPPRRYDLAGAHGETGLDSLIEFRMRMSAADFEAFLAGNGLAATAFRPGPAGLLGADHGFWTPGQEKALSIAAFPRGAGRTLDVAVTPPDADGVVTVYVRAFTL
ncbi:MAG: hypothetical protein JNK46_06085 [Methylobacteriaceae bacterium]|nr:hypothetical protein [Methylobacteriaceae bacterium]